MRAKRRQMSGAAIGGALTKAAARKAFARAISLVVALATLLCAAAPAAADAAISHDLAIALETLLKILRTDGEQIMPPLNIESAYDAILDGAIFIDLTAAPRMFDYSAAAQALGLVIEQTEARSVSVKFPPLITDQMVNGFMGGLADAQVNELCLWLSDAAQTALAVGDWAKSITVAAPHGGFGEVALKAGICGVRSLAVENITLTISSADALNCVETIDISASALVIRAEDEPPGEAEPHAIADAWIAALPPGMKSVTLRNLELVNISSLGLANCETLCAIDLAAAQGPLRLADVPEMPHVTRFLTNASAEHMPNERWQSLPPYVALLGEQPICVNLGISAPAELRVGETAEVSAREALVTSDGFTLPNNVCLGVAAAMPAPVITWKCEPEGALTLLENGVKGAVEGDAKLTATLVSPTGDLVAYTVIKVLASVDDADEKQSAEEPNPDAGGQPGPGNATQPPPGLTQADILAAQWNAWIAYVRAIEQQRALAELAQAQAQALAQAHAQAQAQAQSPYEQNAEVPYGSLQSHTQSETEGDASAGQEKLEIPEGALPLTVTALELSIELDGGERVKAPGYATLELLEERKSGEMLVRWGDITGVISKKDAPKVSKGKAIDSEGQWMWLDISTTLRDSAASRGKGLKRVESGTPLLTLGPSHRDGWTSVLYRGKTAYVRSSYLLSAPPD